MTFLNAWPLWAGLAALGVAIPVLIHLWSRNQKFDIPWAAMELLKKAMIARSRKIQVEDYILMLLRALALLLIALALDFAFASVHVHHETQRAAHPHVEDERRASRQRRHHDLSSLFARKPAMHARSPPHLL